jgi:hypothetical protein
LNRTLRREIAELLSRDVSTAGVARLVNICSGYNINSRRAACRLYYSINAGGFDRLTSTSFNSYLAKPRVAS